MTTLRFSHSHLYPGARGRTAHPLPEGRAPMPCTVAFADGTEAAASLSAGGGSLVLRVAPHVTARGTAIPAKRWALAAGGREGADTLVRVAARLPDG